MREKTRVEQYIPLARKIARAIFRAGKCGSFEVDDFIGAGFEGLCKADRQFDEKYGVPFDKYAGIKISSAIHDMICKDSFVSKHHYKMNGFRVSANSEAIDILVMADKDLDLLYDLQVCAEKLTPVKKQLILGYLAGKSVRAIAIELGVSHQYLYQVLAEAGREIRPMLKGYKF